MMTSPPLIAHVIQRLAVGGLENGLVNLINHMRRDRYRHAIICLTDATEYASRIHRSDVEVIELHQRKGSDLGVHRRLYSSLRQLRPAIVHTRNLPAMEFQVTAALAGVPGRIHGEHGRDIYDLDGKNFKYNALRKAMRMFIHRYIAVSRNLGQWLIDTVKVAPERLSQIYNGVDANKFHPRGESRSDFGLGGFFAADKFVIGTVGRMESVKDQLTLVRAFLHLLKEDPALRQRLRLVLVGDGSLRTAALELLHDGTAEQLAWLPGERDDVADIMRAMDLFVLPSIREGISNTILEAMASGLAVVATNVGGNPEIVEPGVSGLLVPPADPIAMANAIRGYSMKPDQVACHGHAGRIRVEANFSIQSMVSEYLKAYDALSIGRHEGVLQVSLG